MTNKTKAIIFTLILGLSNCGFSVWTLFLSACVGYAMYDFVKWFNDNHVKTKTPVGDR